MCLTGSPAALLQPTRLASRKVYVDIEIATQDMHLSTLFFILSFLPD